MHSHTHTHTHTHTQQQQQQQEHLKKKIIPFPLTSDMKVEVDFQVTSLANPHLHNTCR